MSTQYGVRDCSGGLGGGGGGCEVKWMFKVVGEVWPPGGEGGGGGGGGDVEQPRLPGHGGLLHDGGGGGGESGEDGDGEEQVDHVALQPLPHYTLLHACFLM